MIRLREPRLEFAFDQQLEDPRDGLAMFGPYDRGQGGAYEIRAGVIGTKHGIERFRKWVNSIQRGVGLQDAARFRPPFPGFEAVFQIAWNPRPTLAITIDANELDRLIRVDDKYKRIYGTVDYFASKLIEAKTSEEEKPDLWFVIIPDEVHKLCRPESIVPRLGRIQAEDRMKPSLARGFIRQRPLSAIERSTSMGWNSDSDSQREHDRSIRLPQCVWISHPKSWETHCGGGVEYGFGGILQGRRSAMETSGCATRRLLPRISF
jgi:hypothetical protein